jgi:hypothetical protein
MSIPGVAVGLEKEFYVRDAFAIAGLRARLFLAEDKSIKSFRWVVQERAAGDNEHPFCIPDRAPDEACIANEIALFEAVIMVGPEAIELPNFVGMA